MLRKYPVMAKEDPLKFFVVHHKLLYSQKILTPLFYICFFIVIIIIVAASLDEILTKGFNEYMKNHSLGFVLGLYISINLVVEYVILGSNVDTYIHLESYWDIETASSSSKIKLQKKVRQVFVIYALSAIINLIAAIVHLIIECFTDIHLICDVLLIDKLLADYQRTKFLISFICYLAHCFGALSSVSLYLAIKYAAMTLKIQLDLLTEFLNQVKIYKNSEHLEIREHLKICTIHHEFITRFLHDVQKQAGLPIIVLTISGVLSVLGCLTNIYYSDSLIKTVTISLILMYASFLAVDMCKSGQDVQDSFDKFASNLIKVEWYQWNESNKKSLLLMLTRSQKSATISACNIELNHGLIIRFLKAVYQIFLIIKQTM